MKQKKLIKYTKLIKNVYIRQTRKGQQKVKMRIKMNERVGKKRMKKKMLVISKRARTKGGRTSCEGGRREGSQMK
jgi:hypothetical protein